MDEMTANTMIKSASYLENNTEYGENATLSGRTIDWDTSLPWYIIPLVILMCAIPLLGTGNLFAFRFIFKSKDNQTVINELITAMLFTNVLRCHCVIFMEIVDVLQNYAFVSRLYCQMRIFLRSFGINFRILLCVYLAVLRAYVCMKMVIVKVTKRQIRMTIVAAILMSGLLSATNVVDKVPQLNLCTLTFGQPSKLMANVLLVKRFIYAFLFLAAFCSYIILGVYINIIKRKFHTGKKDLFSIKLGVMLSSMFALSYILPYFGYFVLPTPYEKDPLTTAHLAHYFTLLTYLDTVMDPIIFAMENKYFRRSVWPFKQQNSVVPSGNGNLTHEIPQVQVKSSNNLAATNIHKTNNPGCSSEIDGSIVTMATMKQGKK